MVMQLLMDNIKTAAVENMKEDFRLLSSAIENNTLEDTVNKVIVSRLDKAIDSLMLLGLTPDNMKEIFTPKFYNSIKPNGQKV